MSTDRISLDEASWRLEQSNISGAVFAELLLSSEPLLSGQFPGKALLDPVDLSRATCFRVQPENVAIAGDITWTGVKLNWDQLCADFEKRGCTVSWHWFSYITPEALAQASQPTRRRRLTGDPWVWPSQPMSPPAPAVPGPVQRASPEWFAAAVYAGLVPASGKPPQGKRGPKSHRRENTAAAMRKALADKMLTVDSLRTMRQKELAHRYGVSRDTAQKARHDVLMSFVEIPTSTNDK